MEKMTGGDYGKLIERFEALTTAPEGLYGELEKAVAGTFQAKELLSMVFKVYRGYDLHALTIYMYL